MDHTSVAKAGPSANPIVRARLVEAPMVASNGRGVFVIAIATLGAVEQAASAARQE
jgi:hypothetical protein